MIRNEPDSPVSAAAQARSRGAGRNVLRLARYVLLRAVTVVVMVVVGMFLAVVVLNLGGYVDQIARADIDAALMGLANQMAMQTPPFDDPGAVLKEAEAAMVEAAGLNEPFLSRCLRWTRQALTLDWGQTRWMERLEGARKTAHDARLVILDRLPYTLLLAGVTNLVVFIASLGLAMGLSRNSGGLRDRLFGLLSLASSVPSWIYGVVMVVLFSQTLQWLPAAGVVDGLGAMAGRDRWQLIRDTVTPLGYALSVARHMVLPAAAITLSTLFGSVYLWRTVFLINAQEDYVEMARARGLPPRTLERRYLLRPALPPILTSLALMLVTFWEGTLALETLFHWPGIGSLFLEAVHSIERAVTMGTVVIFAYLLAITILLLDFAYALVDPRIRLGAAGPQMSSARTRRRLWPLRRRRPRRPTTGLRPAPAARAEPDAEAGRERPKRRRARGPARARELLREIGRYPSAVVGLVMIAGMVALSIYTAATIPYEKAALLYRSERADKYEVPPLAQPAWVNLFRRDKLPETVLLSTLPGRAEAQARAAGLIGARPDDRAVKVVTPGKGDTRQVAISLEFDYPYAQLPQDLTLRFVTSYQKKMPFVDSLVWHAPDGREVDLGRFSTPTRIYNMSWFLTEHRENLIGGRGGVPAVQTLFGDPAAPDGRPVQGRYRLDVSGYTFEPGCELDAELIVQGRVYGLAGTDDAGRDLTTILLWGAPIALAFGLVGAIGTTLATMAIAATSAWYGGWLDDAIQRLTEVSMLLPTLPLAIMVFYAYSKSVWVVLGVIVLMSTFGSSLKSMRAIFLQAKDSPYVEAARAYGASDARIIVGYLIPRVLPMIIPRLLALIPTYVFLEATLAYLGVSNLLLPTWGRLVMSAFMSGALEGHYYWALEPALLLLLSGAGFSLLALALDNVLNPRLRSS